FSRAAADSLVLRPRGKPVATRKLPPLIHAGKVSAEVSSAFHLEYDSDASAPRPTSWLRLVVSTILVPVAKMAKASSFFEIAGNGQGQYNSEHRLAEFTRFRQSPNSVCGRPGRNPYATHPTAPRQVLR